MVYENYINITIPQVIGGSQYLNPSTLIVLLTLCFGVAFGAQWGFNKIYNENRIERFKKYKNELIFQFKIKLKKLALTNYKGEEDFNKEISKFIEEWQYFNDNIKNYYNRLFWWRIEILIIFSLGGISYFIRLIRPDLLIREMSISLISNFLFIVGLISIFIFGYKVIKLDSQIAKYTMEKPIVEEITRKIAERVLKKTKSS